MLGIVGIRASGDFSQTHTCGPSVAVGASCTLSVTFKPTATGTRTGTLTITDNSIPPTQTVSLTGTGGAKTTVTYSPTSLTFSAQTVGTASPAQIVTLTNTGSATLSIASISASGDSSQTNNCGSSVAPTGSSTLSVTFNPRPRSQNRRRDSHRQRQPPHTGCQPDGNRWRLDHSKLLARYFDFRRANSGRGCATLKLLPSPIQAPQLSALPASRPPELVPNQQLWLELSGQRQLHS